MNSVTMHAMRDELEKIAVEQQQRWQPVHSGVLGGVLGGAGAVAHHHMMPHIGKLNPANVALGAAVGGVGSYAAHKLRNAVIPPKTASVKIAYQGALIGGALGAGGMLISGGMKEWDQRHAEDQAIKKLAPEMQEKAREWVSENRVHRAARLVVRTAIGGAAGAGAGHLLHKGLELGTKTVVEKFKPALQEALAQGHAEGFKRGVETAQPALKKALGEGLSSTLPLAKTELKGALQEGMQGGLWRFLSPFKKK